MTFASIIYSFFECHIVSSEASLGKFSPTNQDYWPLIATTLHKRISKRELGIDIPEKDAVVAVDSTGIKVTRWMNFW